MPLGSGPGCSAPMSEDLENLSSERTVDEWSSAELDLDAYLRRIGYSGPLESNEATLTALYRGHLSVVPLDRKSVV